MHARLNGTRGSALRAAFHKASGDRRAVRSDNADRDGEGADPAFS
jgi:hypothetical protein